MPDPIAQAKRGHPRPLIPRLLIGVVVMLLVTTMVWTARGRETNTLATARRSDLVQLLDQLTQEARRLEDEKITLEDGKRELTSGVYKEEAARTEAAHRIDVLEILAGTRAAKGPGVLVTIRDPQARVDGAMLLDTVEELRDAGAEVIEINQQHRITATTWFGMRDDAITINDRPVKTPLTIEAIGDAHSLEEGLQFRGGIVSQIRNVGGEVQITRVQEIEISSTAKAPTYSYAKRPK